MDAPHSGHCSSVRVASVGRVNLASCRQTAIMHEPPESSNATDATGGRGCGSADEGFVSPIPISEAIFRHLGQEIIHGRLAPGERLLETKLCGELGCSRSPLREALRMLAAENLVTIEPRRGARVAHLTRKGIADLFEVRIELEALAARLAAERGSPEELAALERLNEGMAATVAEPRRVRLLRAERAVPRHDRARRAQRVPGDADQVGQRPELPVPVPHVQRSPATSPSRSPSTTI